MLGLGIDMGQGLSELHATWLGDRGIPIEIAAECGLWSREAALAFPYTIDGEVIFTKWRGPKKHFWIEPSGTRLALWNLDRAASAKSETLIVTEGELDALAWMAAGAPAVVSVPNGAPNQPGEGDIDPTNDNRFAWLWQNGKLDPKLDQFARFVLSTDSDAPGRILGNELAVRLGRDRCWYVTYPDDCKDANDVLKAHGAGALAAMLDDARPVVPRKLVKFSDIPMDNRQSYSTGWLGLDDHFRIRPPELVVIAGTPGSGKSQFALNVGANLARIHKLKGAFLQFEDHPERNREDLLRYAEAWRSVIPDPPAWVDAMFRTIAPAEVTGEDRYTMKWLSETLREAARVHDCAWVVIDPWNEIEHIWGINENEAAYTNKALAELKSIARLLQITLLIVTHPGKAGGAKTDVQETSLYDIAGSAAWRNKADHGIIIVRPEAGADVFIKVDKSKDHRRMGYPGIVRMRFNSRNASYDFVGKGV